ncbi:SLATT domain-containing protein [Cupriavidus taiwanensis]|uniref:SLATT domain-containing protein n=1 Tax=Cupriavidus taiwanensis TaxID=164546 RepID=UPI000E1030C9|nr:SLATT domain-containing protein [Cupriavidus taiwanensis]SPA56697.1 conserved protein of unknown function [Cupriavidus taiwanensis]
METPSRPEQHTAPREGADTLDGQLREMYGRAAYTHKTHEKMADQCTRKYGILKVFEIALSAATTTALLLALFGDSKAGTIVGALCSTVMLGITLYFKEANLIERARRHSDAAVALWSIRERLLSLLVDLKDGRGASEIRAVRDDINDELSRIYSEAPRTSSKAYEAAQNALKNSEELYFSDEELDKMLPQQLRKR